MSSLRYVTTSRTDLDYVASRRHEVEDRPTVSKRLTERKIANTKTAIAFGTHSLDYSTESSSCQNATLTAHSKRSNLPSNHSTATKIKASLTKANFHLGDDDNDASTGFTPINYTPSSLLLDPTGRVHEFRGRLESATENAIKKSSICLGNDDVVYTSITASTIVRHEEEGVVDEFRRIKGCAERLKREHRENNISFPTRDDGGRVRTKAGLAGGSNDNSGDSSGDYWKSSYQRGYQDYSPVVRKGARGRLSAETMRDLKGSHFDFGDRGDGSIMVEEGDRDAVRTHSASVHNMETLKGWDREKEKEKRRVMKEACKKTNFVIGPDTDYI